MSQRTHCDVCGKEGAVNTRFVHVTLDDVDAVNGTSDIRQQLIRYTPTISVTGEGSTVVRDSCDECFETWVRALIEKYNRFRRTRAAEQLSTVVI